MRQYVFLLILFPSLYLLNSSLSWFETDNPLDFYGFWSIVIALHWITCYVIFRLQKRRGETLKEVGLQMEVPHLVKLVILFLLVALGFFASVEWMLDQVTLDPAKLAEIPAFIPKSTGQRLLFILVVFSAGFCEEIIYRGWAISRGLQLGLNKWLTLLLASLSFVFIHGLAGYYYFWMYLIAGIVFGMIFLWTKRLRVNIILHLFIDLLVMFSVLGAIQK